MAKQVSAGRYVANLLRLVGSKPESNLTRSIGRMCKKSRRKDDSLDRRFPRMIPIRLPLDLLTP